MTSKILAHTLAVMIAKRMPFLLSSVFQITKIIFSVLLVIRVFSYPGHNYMFTVRIFADEISVLLMFLASEFAFSALFIFAVFFPDYIKKHLMFIFIIKIFAAFGNITVLILSIVKRVSDIMIGEDQIIILNSKILLLIVLLFIDFAILFIIVLYKRDFPDISAKVEEHDYPEFQETIVEEE